jgi:uncharacterized protein (DUF58 family)
VSPLDLPADLRSRLRRLSLTPLRAAGGKGAGAHASRNRGGGLEFAQYRAYEKGDDLRRMDWRLYARSDHFFVREAERESPVTLWIVLDASASMGQADQARPDRSRLDAARRLAAALIEIALKDGDRFGLAVAAADGTVATPARSGARHRDQLLTELARTRAGGVVDWERALDRLGERFAQHDLVLVLTDGFDEGCERTVERLAAAGRDVCFVQILTTDERDFPFADGRRFVDPETGAEVLGDGRAMRADFLARFAAARERQAARLRAAGVRRVEHFADEAADAPIRALFAGTGRR